MRRLIFNADDFGLTSGINRSVIAAHTEGVLTSATLMANAAATLEALQLAREHSNLGVGCHVVLVDGTPFTDPARVPSLISRGTANFHETIGSVATRAFTGRLDSSQIELEATAQFRKLLTAGVRLTHFDTHKHVHMFPAVLRGLLRSARICGITAVRNPFEPAQPLAFSGKGRVPWKRKLQTRVLRTLRHEFQQQVKHAGLQTTDGTVGIAATGWLDGATFNRIINALPEGTWEFVVHPGYCDDDLRKAHTRLLESRETEVQLLTSDQAREQLKRANIKLISYKDL